MSRCRPRRPTDHAKSAHHEVRRLGWYNSGKAVLICAELISNKHAPSKTTKTKGSSNGNDQAFEIRPVISGFRARMGIEKLASVFVWVAGQAR